MPGPVWEAEPPELDLLRNIVRHLHSGEPLDLLADVSALLTLVDPREYGFGRQDGEPPWSRRELVEMFLGVDRIETSALLAVIAELAGDDELMTATIKRELALRGTRLPEWLARLGEAEVYAAQELVHVLRDGDNIHVGVRFVGGAEMTAVVYIDHNVGTLVKDAFVVPGSLDELEALMRSKIDDPDAEWRPLDLADARVRITDAIQRAAMTVPPFETETWPMCRPIVEWLARRMPPGGRGYERPEWTERDQQELADRFFASPFGAPLDDADHRRLLDSVLWFGTDYGPGDPMRWSAVAVELLLVDWIPRKLVDDADYLTQAPGLLRAFVRFCHAERGIRASLTDETLAAIDLYEPDYQRTIRSPRLQGPLALLARIGALDPDSPLAKLGDLGGVLDVDFDPRAGLRAGLSESVGGDDALRSLDDRPLPDEDFDWADIPDDIHPAVAEVLGLVDACCDELLDAEYRTACRRLLARAAKGDPSVFRRRAKPATAAAAICWLVGKDNDLFRTYAGGMHVKDLTAHFGLAHGSVSQRAGVLLRAAGFDASSPSWKRRLGDPSLLVSERRRRIIELRDGWFPDG